ncbi:MAG TPA: aminoacyl-tRNA hydrolase [Pirellulaceae bacterium]|nr:aminoacyl-tRNA hydrolase [Pirellulaceae bacterium]
MKLIVGLGNPGRKYAGTRHNIGWEVLAELTKRFSADRPKAKFDGELVEVQMESQRVLLLWPLTFMNLSGQCVQPTRDFYKIANEDLLVICDDVSLPCGKLRVRAKGSSGGQNGLKDIIRRLGTDEFPRLRIGIGPPPPGWELADYVLSKFAGDEEIIVREAVDKAAAAVSEWLKQGLASCMNKYN